MIDYVVQKPNATAVNILRSWLRNVGVPTRPGSGATDLVVTKADGGELDVVVYVGDAPTTGVGIPACAMTGKKLAVAVDAFWRITDAAGHERRNPIDRGPEPEMNEMGNPRKLNYQDDEFLVAIKHTEFRRSPNPTPEQWEHYRATLEKVVWRFMRNNFRLCSRNGVGYEDVLQYGRCLIVNFCARHESPNEVFHDNERKCYAYLNQKFNRGGSSLREVLIKKERSVLPGIENVYMGLYSTHRVDYSRFETNRQENGVSQSMDPEFCLDFKRRVNEIVGDAENLSEEERMELIDQTWEDMKVEQEDPGYVSRHCQLDTSSYEARRRTATKLLNDLFQQLPHDKLVETLEECSENELYDVGTRKEASYRLQQHRATCGACQDVSKAWELVWESGPLSKRDLNIPTNPNTSPTGSMTLGRGRWETVDHRHYFRDEVFKDLTWVPNPKKGHLTTAVAQFSLVVDGAPRGTFTLTVSHNSDTASAAYQQHNSMTHLRWKGVRELIAKDSLLATTMRLYRVVEDGVPSYKIEAGVTGA